MHINLFLIPFVIILGILFSGNDIKKRRLAYILICNAVLIFVAAMRSPEWMTNTYAIDTLNYKWYFESAFDTDWHELRTMASLRYYVGSDDWDIGFVALNKIIGIFTRDFHIYSLLVDLIFFIPFSILLYRYCTNCKQIMFAFVFYIALIQIFLFGGARQIFAIGFDLMAFLAVTKRKKWLTLFFLVLGILVHFSSFLFILPLLMIWFGVNPKTLKIAHIICFVTFPFVLLFPQQVIVFMGEVSGLEKYSNYGLGEIQGGATVFILLIEILSLFCMITMRIQELEKNTSMREMYVMAPLFTLLAPLIHADGSMIRISLYYHLFLMFLVPFGIECLSKGYSKTIIYTIVILGLSILTLSGGGGIMYYFFWQR